MELLKVDKLEKSFGRVKVLKDISFSLEKGQVLSIIGASGSGKSTLLRCLAQLETAEQGTIVIDGNTLMENGVYAKKDVQKICVEKVGMVFQSFNLFPHYTILKNIMDAPIRVMKRDPKEVKAEALELLKQMGLEDKANAYPCQLSGGQMQRVAIARALAMHPAILCFDEPTSALDPELTGEVLKVIRNLKNGESTMIVVTHEMEFARRVSDYAIFMANGVIEEAGKPDELFLHPKSERTKAFLGKSMSSKTGEE